MRRHRSQLDLPRLRCWLDRRDPLGLHGLEQFSDSPLVVCDEPLAMKYFGLKLRMTWSIPP